MLTAKEIKKLFEKLNSRLKGEGIKGEIGIVGGAAMCLVYNVRESTKDVDAIFEPSSKIREIAEKIAQEEDIPTDWLNDGVNGTMFQWWRFRAKKT